MRRGLENLKFEMDLGSKKTRKDMRNWKSRKGLVILRMEKDMGSKKTRKGAGKLEDMKGSGNLGN